MFQTTNQLNMIDAPATSIQMMINDVGFAHETYHGLQPDFSFSPSVHNITELFQWKYDRINSIVIYFALFCVR